MNDLGKNLFDQAADMARMQAEGYRQVRERARAEALEEAAKVANAYAERCRAKEWEAGAGAAEDIARYISALKDKVPG